MGVGGVALLGFLVSFAMVIYNIIKYFSLEADSKQTPAIIKELKDTYKVEKGTFKTKIESITYYYKIDVLCNDKIYPAEITEKVEGDTPSEYSIGQEIPVFFNEKKERVTKGNTKKEIKSWAISLVVCFAILVACFAIVAMLDK